MEYFRKFPVLLLHLVPILCLFSCTGNEARVLHIATAANVQFAMKELAADFTEETGIQCEIILGSSGKLMAQIREGAPFDVFVSADMKYPQTLFEDGLTTARPDIYARGQLVLWSLAPSAPQLSALTSSSVYQIAMANPATAPYGRAAEDVLRYYNLYDSVESKLVFGESISQTNQFIISGTAQVGFTSKSVVIAPGMADKGKWTLLDTAAYTPILQGVVVIRSEDEQETEAEEFRNYLLGEDAAKILSKYGYLTKNNP